MGLLVGGKWHDQWYDTNSSGGHFVRSKSQFRNWVTPDGAPGPSGEGGFKAEPGRYHLYVSLACPWAHRTIIYRRLKDLEPLISMSVVNAYMGPEGWTFAPGHGVVPDDVNGATRLHEIYTKADPGYSGRVTVPVLWDRSRNTIVSNESAEIIRMLNTAFNEVGANGLDLYPPELRAEIDELNDDIYPNVNNGVYKAGFATEQAPYEEAVRALFAALDKLESRLSERRYLTGDRITEADWRLFTTLVRFDAVYVGHFKCNLRELRDYRNLWGYLRDLYQQPGVADTVDIDYIKDHYYRSQVAVNPTGVVPVGPTLDFDAPHGRERLAKVGNAAAESFPSLRKSRSGKNRLRVC
ncbi:MAG: glutathione S-transferase family protein [Chromatiales bacterium]|nr:MAG: glutathione S-transferase family protein [Chromatiales bacterium]